MDFDRLDAILKERKISRRKLALAVGIKEGTMSTAFMRRSGLSPDQVRRIADYLGVNYYYLEGWDLEYAVIDNGFEQAVFVKDGIRKSVGSENRKAYLEKAFDKLNDIGQTEAVKRIEELTEIPRYRKDN